MWPNRERCANFCPPGGAGWRCTARNSVLQFLKGRGWDAPRTAADFMAMVGSQFLAHPPIQPYRVEVSDESHPLVAGIEPFEADDELYLSEYHGAHRALLHTHYAARRRGSCPASGPAPQLPPPKPRKRPHRRTGNS